MNVDVVLPAGGRITGPFAAEVGTEIKALYKIGPDVILDRTIRTLRATGRVGRIVVVGPQEVSNHPAAEGADEVLPEGASGPENIYRGLDWLQSEGTAEDALVVTTDLPFLSPAAVTGFLDACEPGRAICLPILQRQEYEARFPGLKNVFVRLSDGEYTMGCVFRVNGEAMRRGRRRVEEVFAARKSQMAMARLLGLSFIYRLATRRLTVPDIEARCSYLLGCTGQAVPGCAPELAFDIDDVEDYRYAVENARVTQ